MKRGIGILLMMAMLLGCLPASAQFSDLEESSYQYEIQELEALGIITGFNDGTVRPKDKVTRAEFAVIIMNMLNMSAENPDGQPKFPDVSKEHWAFDEINFLTQMGYLTGYTDGTFCPDNNITGSEALKVLIHILGYQYQTLSAGYPVGYQTTALSIDLLKGLSLNFEGFLSREETCKLVNNALTIPVMEQTVTGQGNKYTANPDVTILSKYLKAGKEEGIVEANDLISLGGSLAFEDCILIDGVNYKGSDPGLRNLIGYSVDYLYKLDDSDVRELLLIRANEKNKELTISRQQYLDFEGNRITYEDENGKTLSASINPTADIFLNGDYFQLDKEVFEKAEMGEIRLLSNERSSYNVVFITIYETITAGVIDKTNEIVSDEEDNTKKLNLSGDDKDVGLTMNGSPASFSDIKRFDVITYTESDNRIEATICRNTVKGTVDSVMEDQETKFLIKGQEYPLSPHLDYDKNAQYTGKSVKAYLDVFGKIAYLTVGQTSGNTILYLIALSNLGEELDPRIAGKFYDLNAGLVVYDFADKVQVVTASEELRLTEVSVERLNSLLAIDGKISQTVMIHKNAEGKIDRIEQPKPIDELEKSGSDGFCTAFDFAERKWLKDNSSFEHKIRLDRDNTTLVASIPSDPLNASEKEFRTLKSTNLQNDKMYNIAAYHSSVDFNICDFIVIITDEQAAQDTISVDTRMSVVEKVSTVVNEDGDIVTRVYARTGSVLDYFDDREDLYFSYKNAEGTEIKRYTLKDLSQGDIIRYETNSFKECSIFNVLHDESGDPALGGEHWIGPAATATITSRLEVIRSTVAKRIGYSAQCVNPGFNVSDSDYINIALNERMLEGHFTVIEKSSDGRMRIRAGTMDDFIYAHYRYAMIFSIVIVKEV